MAFLAPDVETIGAQATNQVEAKFDQFIFKQKAIMRAQLRSSLRSLFSEDLTAASQQVCQRLERFAIWRRARSILYFAPLADEPDVWPLLVQSLAENKIVALPCFQTKDDSYEPRRISDLTRDLLRGKFSVREPATHCPAIPTNQLDLVLVPGVGFAPDGRRLGRGKGYYDRLLANVRGAKCGLAFDQQVVGEIPAEPHDQLLDYVVTPTRLMATNPGSFK